MEAIFQATRRLINTTPELVLDHEWIKVQPALKGRAGECSKPAGGGPLKRGGIGSPESTKKTQPETLPTQTNKINSGC
jgi:hypothetical protein